MLVFVICLCGWLTDAKAQESKVLVEVKQIVLEDFDKITIKSGVTVMLIEDEEDKTARIEGSGKFVERVLIIQNGKELIIRTTTLQDQKKKGVIYIPVHMLSRLDVQASAAVMTMNTISSPVLYVHVNGNCILDLSLKGKLNIEEEEGLNFTYRRIFGGTTANFINNQNHNF